MKWSKCKMPNMKKPTAEGNSEMEKPKKKRTHVEACRTCGDELPTVEDQMQGYCSDCSILAQNKPARGGKREGAGRPQGSGKGRTVKTSSISLTPALWGKLDEIRGDNSRSAWVADKIKKSRTKTSLQNT